MMNIIRADIYRIFRGKAIYITFALLLLLNVLVVATSSPGGLVVSVTGEETVASYADENFVYDGKNIPEVLYNSTPNLIYFLLPLLIAVAAPMFSHGTVKNSLSFGISRTKLYFAKLILSSGLTLLMMLFYMSSGILIATVIRGYGGTPPDGYWLNILKICSAQLFMLIAMNCMGVYLVFASKRTAIVNGAYIAFCLVPTAIIMALILVDPDFSRLFDFEFNQIILRFGTIETMKTRDFVTSFATGAFFITVPTVAGIISFRKAEIK